MQEYEIGKKIPAGCPRLEELANPRIPTALIFDGGSIPPLLQDTESLELDLNEISRLCCTALDYWLADSSSEEETECLDEEPKCSDKRKISPH
jgi:hypothetical protein